MKVKFTDTHVLQDADIFAGLQKVIYLQPNSHYIYTCMYDINLEYYVLLTLSSWLVKTSLILLLINMLPI